MSIFSPFTEEHQLLRQSFRQFVAKEPFGINADKSTNRVK